MHLSAIFCIESKLKINKCDKNDYVKYQYKWLMLLNVICVSCIKNRNKFLHYKYDSEIFGPCKPCRAVLPNQGHKSRVHVTHCEIILAASFFSATFRILEELFLVINFLVKQSNLC